MNCLKLEKLFKHHIYKNFMTCGGLFNNKDTIEAAITLTRRLVNVRSHMMFRPELIYIFDLIVNQMKR